MAVLTEILQLLRDDRYWLTEMPDISFERRDTLLPPLFLELGYRTRSIPYSMLIPTELIMASDTAMFAHGSFADVFGGTYNGKEVSLKHPRYNTAMEADPKVLDIQLQVWMLCGSRTPDRY